MIKNLLLSACMAGAISFAAGAQQVNLQSMASLAKPVSLQQEKNAISVKHLNGRVLESKQLAKGLKLQKVQTADGIVVKRLVGTDVANNKINPKAVAGASLKGETGDATTLNESFEDWDGEDNGWLPEGWSKESKEQLESDYITDWFISYNASGFLPAFDGLYAAMINFDTNYKDEWLISPVYSHASLLEFYSYIDPMVLEYDTYEGYDDHYYVKVSHDGGNTWQVIWDARTQCSPDGGWQLVSLPLGAATPDTRIAFHAVSGKASATDHLYFLWAIDDVRISGPAPAAPISKAASTTSFGGYNIYLDGQLIAGSINARQYTDVSEKAEGEHTYRVAFYDALTDEESEGVQTTVNILAPTFDAPLNVQVSSRYDSEQGYTAVITWDEPQGNQKPEGYIVYCNGMWAGYGITETSFENTGLTKGVYEYKVSAMYDNPSGESEAVAM